MRDLSEAGKQELVAWAQGASRGPHRRTCPDCSADRRNYKAQCLSTTIEDDRVVYTCWHCEAQGMAMFHVKHFVQPVKKLERSVIKESHPADAVTKAYLKGRGITETTIEVYDIGSGRAFFPDLQRETHCLLFPYHENGKAYGHKARSTDDKAHVCKPALNSLFGQQLIDLSESPDIVITEGEIDALAMFEAGVLNAVSVPNGAASFKVSNENDTKATYSFLWSARKELDAAKRIIIATDNDEPGERLREEIARRIGKHRCWLVSFPDDCKDANDMLLKHGKDRLKQLVADAQPVPVEGLHEADHYLEKSLDLYRNGFGDRVLTGLNYLDEIYSVGKGLLTVITGVPSHGKSTFVDCLMVNLARRYGYMTAICSFENQPPVHIGKLAQIILQKHFFKTDKPGPRMSEDEYRSVMPFINKHFKFLFHDDGKKASLESIIERIKTAVFRWGVQCVVIDPYNYIVRPKSAANETEWIDDMLTQLRLLAAAYDLHIWFIAHPTKLQADAEGNYAPPKGYSISGSAAWYSKPDFGLTIYRTGSAVRIINWKTRFDWLGKDGEARCVYDNTRHIYLADVASDMAPLRFPRMVVNNEEEEAYQRPH